MAKVHTKTHILTRATEAVPCVIELVNSAVRQQPANKNIFAKITVQKSYNRPGRLDILGLFAICKINNLRVINTPVETDPDQVHDLFNNLQMRLFTLAGKWPEIF